LRVLTPEDPLTPRRARGRLPAGPAALALSRAPAGEGADREQPHDEASDVREERHSAFGAPDGSQPAEQVDQEPLPHHEPGAQSGRTGPAPAGGARGWSSPAPPGPAAIAADAPGIGLLLEGFTKD